MSDRIDDIKLVKKAQLGDRGSLNRLAEIARVRLHEYVLRLTLNEDLTQDIVQETILEMLRIFNKLRKAEMFWAWLHGIAFNKVRNHYGKRWRRRTHNFSEAGFEPAVACGNDTLTEVVTEELKQIVVRSVAQLAPRHRAVLTMRCYDHLSYAQIAKLTGCSEIGARATFYRAKKCLARRLAAYGLGKGSLLLALVAFGKMTATSKVSAAQVAVSGATLRVGPMAVLLATATGKTGCIVLAAASTLAVGSVAVDSERVASVLAMRSRHAETLGASLMQYDATQQQEWWYYFPDGGSNAVIQRLVQSDTTGKNPVCRILQNQYANYHFDRRRNAVHINNYRAWKPDLSVMRLPTDSPDLSDFIAQVEGQPADMELAHVSRNRLLVICNQRSERGSTIWRIDRHTNVLNEEYFQVSWPESMRVIDNRDAMHRRGWAYFQVSGHLDGDSITGAGRLPFVYASAREHFPWMKIRVGRNATFIDTPTGACLYDREGRIARQSSGGSFFEGLLRPWMGLHCIDTIRRDAAAQRLQFETIYNSAKARAEVTVHAENVTMVYTVNMETDVIETINFFTRAAVEPNARGQLHFVYLQELPDVIDPLFTTPPDIRPGSAPRQQIGILWLARLLTSQ